MKLLIVALLALAAIALLLPGSAAAGTDYDCSDFANQAEAQESALFLDRFEELRMELSDQSLGSVFGLGFYTGERKHVRMFGRKTTHHQPWIS